MQQNKQLTRGCFERIAFIDGRFEISGWMLSLDYEFDAFRLEIDGKVIQDLPVHVREDVGKAFPFLKYGSQSGFRFDVKIGTDQFRKPTPVRIEALSDGKVTGYLNTSYARDAASGFPLPPEHLRYRITRNNSANYYVMSSLHSFHDYWSAINEYGDPSAIKAMLDWGGGSGRMHPFFIKYTDIQDIHACDIDPEAITWANENIPEVDYSVIPPYPPTGYKDNQFDLIISYSVCTHLTEDVQLSWIKEMHRILKPGGLFLTTVHGRFAMRWSFPPKTIQMIEQKGFFDDPKDDVLDGISPENYYRATFQTKEYTVDKWNPLFEVLDYKEAGALSYQDLVVLRK